MQYKNFTNRADLLEAAAHSIRMQEKAGIEPKYKYCGVICGNWSAMGGYAGHYEFPLAVIEGKPVFEGDELWNVPDNSKFVAKEMIPNHCGEGDYICNGSKFGIGGWVSDCSWNPPKPKTVMIELREEVAQYLAARDVDERSISEEVTNACRKALEAAK